MKYNIYKHIGKFHLCGMIMQNVYGFIIGKNNLFDKLYIISFASITFSWIIFKDECVVSYIIKKIENPNYILGNEPDNVKDISSLFTNERQYIIFHNINILLRIGSVIIVNKRTTHIDYLTIIPTCLLQLFYIYDVLYKLNYRKKMYPYFQITLCLYLFTTICKTIGV